MTARRWLLPLRGADPSRRPPPDLDLGSIDGSPSAPATPVVEGEEAGRMLVFSDTHTLRRWRSSARVITVTDEQIRALASRLAVGEIVWDVAGPVRRRERVEATGSGSPPPPFSIRGLAGPLTPQVCEEIRDVLGRKPPVDRLWVVEATVDGRDVLVVALETVAGTLDPEAVARAVSSELLPLLPTEHFDGVQVVIPSDPEIQAAVVAADRPLYERA